MPIDLTFALKKYKDSWVALSKDKTKVIAAGKTIEDVLKKTKRKKATDAILMSVPQSFDFYIRLSSK